MTEEREQAQTAMLLIEQGFARRQPPVLLSDSLQLSDVEYEEVMTFDGMRWQEVTVAHLEKAPDAIFWFSPEAFCYFLPGALLAGLRENRHDLNFFDSVIGCLDRSPEPAYWDDFFAPRFTRLSAVEIDAVAAWARWLELVEPHGYLDFTYERVQDTLALLKSGIQALP